MSLRITGDNKMTEERKMIAQLQGRVDLLQRLIEDIVCNLLERANYNITQGVREKIALMEEAARIGGDDAKDAAVAAWDTGKEMSEFFDMWRDELNRGERLRTVQPSPIAAGDRVTKASGY
jgi:hypothetical protein